MNNAIATQLDLVKTAIQSGNKCVAIEAMNTMYRETHSNPAYEATKPEIKKLQSEIDAIESDVWADFMDMIA